MNLKRPRRFGVPAALMAVLALVLALPAGASALEPGEYEAFSGATKPWQVTSGPDGNVWFSDQEAAKVGRVIVEGAERGTVTEYGGLSSAPYGIAGAAGSIWWSEFTAEKIGTCNPANCESSLVEYSIPGGGTPTFMTAGPDGNVWYVDPATAKIGRVITSGAEKGTITEYGEADGLKAGGLPCRITAGSDGNVWFGDCGTKRQIGKITPSGSIEEYFLNEGLGTPLTMALNSDGNIWAFLSSGAKGIVSVTPSGKITYYTAPSVTLRSLASAPGEGIWGVNLNKASEVQKVTIKTTEGTQGGRFKLSFEGQSTGATFKGDLESGSAIVKNVTTETGAISKNEQVFSSAAGFPSGVVRAKSIISPTQVELSAAATATTAGAEFSSDLAINGNCGIASVAVTCSSNTVREALEKLPTIGTGNVTVSGTGGSIPPLVREIEFTGKFTQIDVPLLTCDGSQLTGTSPSCTVETITEATPEQMIRIKPGGASGMKLDQFALPPTTAIVGLFPAGAITAGSDGNLWFGTENAGKIGTFGLPNNRGTLTLSKSGTGQGSVASKPKGIKCGNTCPTAVASLYKDQKVVLTAKAAVTAGSTLEGWEGCDSSTSTGAEGTCTIEKMSKEENVVAKFGGTAKAVLNPKALTLSKAGGGKGTVKASGLACEFDCTSTEVEYTGGEGKKLPAMVTLTQIVGAESTFAGWQGCDSEKEGACVVTMNSAKSVTATFYPLPVKTLTLNKSGTGQGSVASKPKGIKCGNTCPTATMEVPQDTKVTLTAKAAVTAGSNFEGWSAGCEAETKSEAEGTCTVKVEAAATITAEFGKTKKALLNAKVLTLTKAGSGQGTVKASGLACEAACTTTQGEYTGGEGKKLPAMVTLEAISAVGSKKTVVWSGCDSEKEGKCVVTMSSAKEVTAKFDELE